MTTIEADYETTIRAAVREAAAYVGFCSGRTDDGAAIFRHEQRIADLVIERLVIHYGHTRKAKTQRKVQ